MCPPCECIYIIGILNMPKDGGFFYILATLGMTGQMGMDVMSESA